ncbi:MAG: A/G-specific adenine glycosylase [Firmicutes bacterium HGW-Firmicutes-19]|nr:MAG: A/G-specific adenine glycosylase [Firmicutes bacterium HGW-Firmicutes-19]
MIARELISWYRKNKRELPFRLNKDPYSVWVSEIMAQQTRIETMLPYYSRWMKQFPDIKTCAEADENDILKAWEGLGYYRRAKMLWAGAKLVVADYGGIFPSIYDDIIKIPGIGDYTAAAISSIAFDQPVAAVDGNVLRVVSRLMMSERDVSKDVTKKYVAQILEEWMAGSDPSDFTQGLMELGALVCKVPTPECEKCPISKYCLSFANNNQSSFPVKSASKKPVQESYIVHIVIEKGYLLVSKDWSDGLMEGYLRLPQVDADSQHFDIIEALSIHKHVFSHKIWSLSVVKSSIRKGVELSSFWKWIPLEEVDKQPWISAHRKILQRYLKKSDFTSL